MGSDRIWLRRRAIEVPSVRARWRGPILGPAEHDLDPVALFVSTPVVSDGHLALLPARDAGVYSFVFQRFSEPTRAIAAISEQACDFRKAARQCPCANVNADLSGSHKEVQRPPWRSHVACDFVFRFPFVRPIRRPPPLLTPVLDAVRRALRSVASIITVFSPPYSAARPVIILAKMPFSLRPIPRLESVLCSRTPWAHRAAESQWG